MNIAFQVKIVWRNQLVHIVKGGYPIFGRAIGILMTETSFPRIPGDIGNATTFDFPVAYKIIKGATGRRIVEESDSTLLEPYVRAAQELEKEGVKAITTNCGYLAIFQSELASAVDIPVFTSSLMQIPLVHSMLKKDKKIGILTSLKKFLTKKHLETIDVESFPMVIYGMDNATEWQSKLHSATRPNFENPVMDIDKIEREIVELAKTMAKENPDVGAIVCECHNMAPYASSIQKATGLPVFDITTLMKYVYSSIIRKEFRGWL